MIDKLIIHWFVLYHDAPFSILHDLAYSKITE